MQGSFEASIYAWSLRFINPEVEARYKEERRGLKRVPKAIVVFFVIAAVTMVVMYVIDILNGLLFDPNYSAQYTFTVYDVLSYIAIVPIIGIEYVFFKCQRLAPARGTVLTVALYLAAFYISLSFYSNFFDYPVFGGA